MKEKIETKLEEIGDKIEVQVDKIEDAAAERFPGVKSAIDGVVSDVEAAADAFADTMEDIVDDFVGDDDCEDECCCGHDHDHGEDCDCGCEEIFEIEIDEEDIIGYIYDEDDNEIGFIIIDEDGEEVELFYAEEGEYEYVEVEEEPASTPSKKKKADDDEFDLGITREGVAETTSDMNAIYKEGIQVAAELKSTFDDISAGFDFLKKK